MFSRSARRRYFLATKSYRWEVLAVSFGYRKAILGWFLLVALDLSAAPFAYRPNDPWFPIQLTLDSRNTNTGVAAIPDLNVRAAWPYTRGAGVTIAVGDVGVELDHPELGRATPGMPHRNFTSGDTNGNPSARSGFWAHGTGVAGLAVAAQNNSLGMSGIAPEAGLASWVLFRPDTDILSSAERAAVYPFASNLVDVQVHAWTPPGGGLQIAPDPAELNALAVAVEHGRNGLGSVIIRSGGNGRQSNENTADNLLASDPRVIAVAATDVNGRAVRNSEPGAPLLVATPVIDGVGNGLFSTDLTGRDGVTFNDFFPPNQDLNNYRFNALGMSGTSASAAQIGGVAALILSANPALTYRDVQQVLLLSSRHTDFGDPDVTTNGAGFVVSHNVGYGIPDAGCAVRLARRWSNRPPVTEIRLTNSMTSPIPDRGHVVRISGVVVSNQVIEGLPSRGVFPDQSTAIVELVDVGAADVQITADLTGKAALIRRFTQIEPPPWRAQIENAVSAGAEFAIVYNATLSHTNTFCLGGENLCLMDDTDFLAVPAIFLRESHGQFLSDLIATNSAARVQIEYTPVTRTFNVNSALSCEHVGIRLRADHPARGDLRITLISPAGVRSVLQRLSSDPMPGPIDWTYWSTHHFGESSVGAWTLAIGDQLGGFSGDVLEAELILRGTAIADSDADGLDDNWETQHLGNLSSGPLDDPDGDGFNNAREQMIGSLPNAAREVEFRADLSKFSPFLSRLSWPSNPGRTYEITASGALGATSVVLTNVLGRADETELFLSSPTNRFLRIRELGP